MHPGLISSHLEPITNNYRSIAGSQSIQPLNCMDINPTDEMIERISDITGRSHEYLKSETLRSNLPLLRDFMFLGTKLINITPEKNDYIIESSPECCPHCLAEQIQEHGENYLQKTWSLSLITKCSKHKIYMQDNCPSFSFILPMHPYNRMALFCQNEQDFERKLNCSLCNNLYCKHQSESYLEDGVSTDGVEEEIINAITKNYLPRHLGGPGNAHQIQYTIQDFINLWGVSFCLPEQKEFIIQLKSKNEFKKLESVDHNNFGRCNLFIRSKIMEAVSRHFSYPEVRQNPMQHLDIIPAENMIHYLKRHGVKEKTIPLINVVRWPECFWYKTPTKQFNPIKSTMKFDITSQSYIIKYIERRELLQSGKVNIEDETKQQLTIAFRLLSRIRHKLDLYCLRPQQFGH